MINTMLAALSIKFDELRSRSEDGQGLVEYALILVLISLAALAVMGPLGNTIDGIFGGADTALQNTPAPPAT